MATSALRRAARAAAQRLGAAGAAVGSLGAASSMAMPERPVLLEEAPTYSPPPRFNSSFDRLRVVPGDKAGQLAWAVKNLEVDKVQELLTVWPEGAKLIDTEDNTLFHLAADQPARCKANPAQTQIVMSMLLRDGWDVVDMKNKAGQRAEVVAAKQDPSGPAKYVLASRSYSFMENLRTEEPLSLVGDDSPEPWMWEYALQDEQRRSFAGVYKRAFDSQTCEEWMRQIIATGSWYSLPGTPRRVCWYVSQECSDVPYRYSGLEYPPTVFSPLMEEIRAKVCEKCGIPPEEYPNSCNVAIYEDHQQEVGWHSDDEVMFQGLAGDTKIVSFSLGVPRDFSWRLQGTTETVGTASLGDGDIMTMEGLFQKHYKHCVPKSVTTCGVRINFTFRWIKVKAHAVDAGVKGVYA